MESSPRAWGCFHAAGDEDAGHPVFPTCVGVFLASVGYPIGASGLPHVRGGVSDGVIFMAPEGGSSPRAWGCFPKMERSVTTLNVFPTCVGVFP